MLFEIWGPIRIAIVIMAPQISNHINNYDRYYDNCSGYDIGVSCGAIIIDQQAKIARSPEATVALSELLGDLGDLA